MSVHLVLSSCPDTASAERIASMLVEERLAACVNLLPGVTSIYRWQGRVERAGEIQLLIKTTHECLPAVIARVQALHPHELPEVIAVEVRTGLPAYLDWVAAETREEA